MDDYDWIDKVRDWDWDLTDIWVHWLDTAMYYLDTIGWPAYAAIFLSVVLIGLSLDLTHHWTSMMLARSWGAVVYVVFTLLGVVLGWLYLGTNRFIFARLRDSARMFRDYRKQRAP
ncbi:MAG: hypothetical protein RJQ08_11475 [Salinisphaeraceae bacterium]